MSLKLSSLPEISLFAIVVVLFCSCEEKKSMNGYPEIFQSIHLEFDSIPSAIHPSENRTPVLRDKRLIQNLVLSQVICDSINLENELRIFNSFIDSIKIGKDTLEALALTKLNLLKRKFNKSENKEIHRRLKQWERLAFSGISYSSTMSHQLCFQNPEIPEVQRIFCYRNLQRAEMHNANFESVFANRKEFERTIDGNLMFEFNYYHSAIDSVDVYLKNIDRIENLDRSRDTIEYLKSMALKPICETHFFCHEGCGGCDYFLLFNSLNSFKKRFPRSQLGDNAEYSIILYSIMEGTSFSEQFIQSAETFLIEFPQSDLIEKVYLDIIYEFIGWEYMTSSPRLEKWVDRYLSEFPNNKQAEKIQALINTKL